MAEHRVASLGEIPEGQTLGVEAEGIPICLANVEGTLYAVRNNCTHQDFPLTDGRLEGDRIECAWHGARFDVTTGRAVALPAIRPVKTYEVRVDGDDVFVTI